MPNGPNILTLSKSEGSYKEVFRLAFSQVGQDKPALVILENYEMKSTEEEILEARKATVYDNLTKEPKGYSQNLLVGIEAVKACKRHTVQK